MAARESGAGKNHQQHECSASTRSRHPPPRPSTPFLLLVVLVVEAATGAGSAPLERGASSETGDGGRTRLQPTAESDQGVAASSPPTKLRLIDEEVGADDAFSHDAVGVAEMTAVAVRGALDDAWQLEAATTAAPTSTSGVPLVEAVGSAGDDQATTTEAILAAVERLSAVAVAVDDAPAIGNGGSGSGSGEKRGKFINGNATNVQQLSWGAVAAASSLAAMTPTPLPLPTTYRPVAAHKAPAPQPHKAVGGGASEKNLLDWTQIVLHATEMTPVDAATNRAATEGAGGQQLEHLEEQSPAAPSADAHTEAHLKTTLDATTNEAASSDSGNGVESTTAATALLGQPPIVAPVAEAPNASAGDGAGAEGAVDAQAPTAATTIPAETAAVLSAVTNNATAFGDKTVNQHTTSATNDGGSKNSNTPAVDRDAGERQPHEAMAVHEEEQAHQRQQQQATTLPFANKTLAGAPPAVVVTATVAAREEATEPNDLTSATITTITTTTTTQPPSATTAVRQPWNGSPTFASSEESASADGKRTSGERLSENNDNVIADGAATRWPPTTAVGAAAETATPSALPEILASSSSPKTAETTTPTPAPSAGTENELVGSSVAYELQPSGTLSSSEPTTASTTAKAPTSASSLEAGERVSAVDAADALEQHTVTTTTTTTPPSPSEAATELLKTTAVIATTPPAATGQQSNEIEVDENSGITQKAVRPLDNKNSNHHSTTTALAIGTTAAEIAVQIGQSAQLETLKNDSNNDDNNISNGDKQISATTIKTHLNAVVVVAGDGDGGETTTSTTTTTITPLLAGNGSEREIVEATSQAAETPTTASRSTTSSTGDLFITGNGSHEAAVTTTTTTLNPTIVTEIAPAATTEAAETTLGSISSSIENITAAPRAYAATTTTTFSTLSNSLDGRGDGDDGGAATPALAASRTGTAVSAGAATAAPSVSEIVTYRWDGGTTTSTTLATKHESALSIETNVIDGPRQQQQEGERQKAIVVPTVITTTTPATTTSTPGLLSEIEAADNNNAEKEEEPVTNSIADDKAGAAGQREEDSDINKPNKNTEEEVDATTTPTPIEKGAKVDDNTPSAAATATTTEMANQVLNDTTTTTGPTPLPTSTEPPLISLLDDSSTTTTTTTPSSPSIVTKIEEIYSVFSSSSTSTPAPATSASDAVESAVTTEEGVPTTAAPTSTPTPTAAVPVETTTTTPVVLSTTTNAATTFKKEFPIQVGVSTTASSDIDYNNNSSSGASTHRTAILHAGFEVGRGGATPSPTPTELLSGGGGGAANTDETTPPPETDVNVIIAISVSVIGVSALLLLVAFLYLMRKRQKQTSYGQRCRPVSLDAYSLDNVSVVGGAGGGAGSVRRKGAAGGGSSAFARNSKRSYGNVAFDDPALRHNHLTAGELIRFAERRTAIFEEFRDVPQIIARADEVPPGCEDKNRYANVIPLPETRVMLLPLGAADDERTEYINANYVRGPKDTAHYYIACQAPLESTVDDFWRMVWEQESRVIIQATDLTENGIEKCAEYLPPSATLDNHTTYGEFQVTLKHREVKDCYAISTIMLDRRRAESAGGGLAEAAASRELTHYWYQWPETGVPSEEAPLIAMLLEARSSLKSYALEEREKCATLRMNDAQNGGAAADGEGGAANGEINGNNMPMEKFKAASPPNGLAARNQSLLTVHCSPGTGRTGTIVACDIAIRCLEQPKRSVDIPQIVYYVRRGRASAVQTKDQYEFIYKVAGMYATKIISPASEN